MDCMGWPCCNMHIHKSSQLITSLNTAAAPREQEPGDTSTEFEHDMTSQRWKELTELRACLGGKVDPVKRCTLKKNMTALIDRTLGVVEELVKTSLIIYVIFSFFTPSVFNFSSSLHSQFWVKKGGIWIVQIKLVGFLLSMWEGFENPTVAVPNKLNFLLYFSG